MRVLELTDLNGKDIFIYNSGSVDRAEHYNSVNPQTGNPESKATIYFTSGAVVYIGESVREFNDKLMSFINSEGK